MDNISINTRLLMPDQKNTSVAELPLRPSKVAHLGYGGVGRDERGREQARWYGGGKIFKTTRSSDHQTSTSVRDVGHCYPRATKRTALKAPPSGLEKSKVSGSCQGKASTPHFPQWRQNHCKSTSESSKKCQETSPWTRPDLCKLLLGHPLPLVGGKTPAVDTPTRATAGDGAHRGVINHRLTRYFVASFKEPKCFDRRAHTAGAAVGEVCWQLCGTQVGMASF